MDRIDRIDRINTGSTLVNVNLLFILSILSILFKSACGQLLGSVLCGALSSTLSIFRELTCRWHKSFVFNAGLFECPLFDRHEKSLANGRDVKSFIYVAGFQNG
jgi:hypothetical protein